MARRRRRRNRAIALFGGGAAVLAAGVAGLLVLPPGDSGPDEPPATAQSTATPPAPPKPEPAPPTTEPEATVAVPAAIDTSTTDGVMGPSEPESETEPGPDSPPGEPAADSDVAPAGSTSAGDDSGRARPVTKRKRNSGTCYFQQDKFNYLQRQRRHSRFVTGKDGRCYDCNDPAPDYRRAQLSPSDCARYYLCVRTGEDQCSG